MVTRENCTTTDRVVSARPTAYRNLPMYGTRQITNLLDARITYIQHACMHSVATTTALFLADVLSVSKAAIARKCVMNNERVAGASQTSSVHKQTRCRYKFIW